MLSYTKSFYFIFLKERIFFFFSWLHLVFVAISGLSLAPVSRHVPTLPCRARTSPVMASLVAGHRL